MACSLGKTSRSIKIIINNFMIIDKALRVVVHDSAAGASWDSALSRTNLLEHCLCTVSRFSLEKNDEARDIVKYLKQLFMFAELSLNSFEGRILLNDENEKLSHGNFLVKISWDSLLSSVSWLWLCQCAHREWDGFLMNTSSSVCKFIF